MVTDPISDFIVRLQNASRARKESVSLPFSNAKFAVAQVLEREGYVGSVAKPKKGAALSLAILYKNGTPAVQGVKRISKPSRRIYLGMRDIKPVKRGHGAVILSTPQGIMTGKEAREKKVGGEALFEIW